MVSGVKCAYYLLHHFHYSSKFLKFSQLLLLWRLMAVTTVKLPITITEIHVDGTTTQFKWSTKNPNDGKVRGDDDSDINTFHQNTSSSDHLLTGSPGITGSFLFHRLHYK